MLLMCLVILLLGESSALRRVTHRTFLRPLHDIRIKIQDTKNAYTTLRSGDIVLYQLSVPKEDCYKALGVYMPDGTIAPLYSTQEGGDAFVADVSNGLNAEQLNQQQKLLRVISGDRRGSEYRIDEFIAPDVYIPVMSEKTAKCDHDTDPESLDRSIPASLKGLIYSTEHYLAGLKAHLASYELSQVIQATKTDAAPIPAGPYSQSVRANGLQFVSGCIATSPNYTGLIEGGIEEQTLQCLQNLAAILGGSEGVRRLCKTTFFVTDIHTAAAVNRLYDEWLRSHGVTVLPARTTVGVNALPLGAVVEIDAIALTPNA